MSNEFITHAELVESIKEIVVNSVKEANIPLDEQDEAVTIIMLAISGLRV
jgi:hypothetical protein